MPTQKIPFPASKEGGFIEIEIPDTVTAPVQVVDIPNEFSFKVVPSVVVPEPPIVTEPPVTGYELTATEGFDKLSDLSFNQIGVSRETDSLAKYFSTTITKDSPGAFKSIVPAGGNSLNSGNRSEQQFNDASGNPKKTHNPTEGAWEYDAYYENWDKVKSHQGHTVQWHPNTGGASACISLQNYGGTFDVVRSLKGANTRIQSVKKSVVSNTWMRHRWEIKFSTGQDGYCRLWVDNVLVCDYKGPTADGSGQYFKISQNKWGTMTTESVVYIDNLKIYKKL